MITGQSVFDRIIQPQRGTFSAEHARYVLSLDFLPEQHARYEALSSKANEGTLIDSEQSELNELLVANTVLTILQSKARISLKNQTTAA